MNKCKSTFTYTINEPDELIQTVDTIIAQTTIKKGAIILKVEGGYGQYYFDWSGPNGFKVGTRDTLMWNKVIMFCLYKMTTVASMKRSTRFLLIQQPRFMISARSIINKFKIASYLRIFLRTIYM
ncbi:MAG: hypothetical protein IPL25_13295 [Saprospiraceae bacterium]|nr:hypothetical protein [Candidatus Vicinibacter affinis]